MIRGRGVADAGPDFLIIGAMKSATGAIYKYLGKHPRVIDRQPKELHFFTDPDLYERGVGWYVERFREKATSTGATAVLIGDASPSYLLFRRTPARVRATFPQVRIIASLRDPTERAISHYHHQVARVGDETRSIEEAFDESGIEAAVGAIAAFESEGQRPEADGTWLTARYLLNGHYASLLEGWFEAFPASQILLVDYGRLASDPRGLMSEVHDFLGLPEHRLTDYTRVYANEYPPPPASVTRVLSRYYEPHNRELEARFGRRFAWLERRAESPGVRRR